MKLKNSWRQQSIETLENHNWGDPATAPTNLVKRCIELSRVPVGNFTFGDLRVMIGQKFGLQYLIPLAIEKLEDNIFVDAELYEGDLLEDVLKIDTSFWDNNENYWTQLNNLIKDKRQEIKEMGITSTNFENSKFADSKSIR
ncbi:MAG: contact-dependent growth inhibition system immunity protein [Ferruginibacter sp.]